MRSVHLHANRYLLPGAIAALAIAIAAGPAGAAEMPPERIYLNARVWTGDPAQPAAEAFAVRGDRFIAVGPAPAIEALAGTATEIVDLEGRRVVPGFNDAHWHLPARKDARLDNAGSVAVIQQRLKDYAATLPAESWVTGRGWMPPDFPGNTAHKRYLDQVFPGRPVVIRDRDGHQALANARALQLAKITRDTPDPADGIIVRDASGEPTGLLKESAVSLVRDLLPALTTEDTYQLLIGEVTEAASLGLTSLQDATEGGLNDNERAAVTRAIAAGRLPVRYRSAVPFDEQPERRQLRRYVEACEAARGSLHACGFAKLILDGTVDAKTAVMLEPYVGGGNGLAFLSQEQLERAVTAYDRAGLQVEIHAIGDAGVRTALDAFERARAAGAGDPRARRHRVEHIETIDPADIPRFGSLGVIASMQPFHADPAPGQIDLWAANIGPERASRAWAWRSILDAGGRVAFGSDWPVVPFDPFIAIHGAVTRQTPAGEPPGGWLPAERLTIAEALAAFTLGPAVAAHAETRRGMIAVGRDADLVVLDRDLLAEAPSAIVGSRVVATVVDGQVVHGEGAA